MSEWESMKIVLDVENFCRNYKGPCHISDVLEEQPRAWNSKKTLKLRIDPQARTAVSELRKPGSRRVIGEDEDGTENENMDWEKMDGGEVEEARGREVSEEGGLADERVP
jgi:hypothetical protein